MKPTVVSADVLFEDHRATLKWEWVAGLGASERRFDEIAVLVEAAVRNAILQLRGINTYQEFVERHRRAMESGN